MKIEVKKLDKGFVVTIDDKTQHGISDVDDLEETVTRMLTDEAKVKYLMYFQDSKSMTIEIDVRSEK